MSNQQDPRRQGWEYRSDHDSIKRTDKPRRTSCRWSADEDKDLCAAFSRGEPIDSLAARHERTEAAIEYRLSSNMRQLLDAARAISQPTPEKAAFAVGDFVLCEFKLWKVAEVVDGVVRELRGFGVLTGNFTEDRIFPLTHRGYTISRTVESNWTSLHDVSRGMQINFPMIHQQIEKAWQHAMNVLDQDAELDKAMREVHAIYSEFIRAIEQARGIRVLGINLFRGA